MCIRDRSTWGSQIKQNNKSRGPKNMARGPKKHLKRIAAPKSWMLSKVGGVYATRSSQGPHKLRESLPLSIVLRKRLTYALNGREVTMIVMDKENQIKIDGKVRRDTRFPCGLMDVINIEKTGERYRILYDTKGRFILRNIKKEEANFKLCKIVKKQVGPNKIPYIVTHDARTIRFPHPDIHVNDTVKLDLNTHKIVDWCHFENGNICQIVGGNNIGRVGIITHRERHLGGFDIVHVKDANGKDFATRIGNIFVLGKGKKSWITLPQDQGLWLTNLEKFKQHEVGTKAE
eukprot:TRINITY_DN8_c0_g1_i4.p1 TRINITY_DN8_c0_g1~~TRINITY_DN8_c0_g1_i4.p1  ORF type:complete len:289 (+),score=80.12 TRINITY_DN8_c0_g1_i4:78-944(+)